MEDQTAGISYSCIGNYKKALKIFGAMHPKRSLSPEDEMAFKRYHAEPAVEYILQQAKTAKIVILNEAHHVPLSRVFMESLLAGLRQEGFDMIGMEGFNDADSNISIRNFPSINTSGYYCEEPCFANMIRKALSLRYRLFGYEYNCQGERELVQAQNIVKKLREYPDSKFVIYCGYDHLIEDTMPGNDSWHHAMAGWLKLMTGIDPLTINQFEMMETSVPSSDNPYRALIHADQAVVMIDDSGRSLMPKVKYNADISVYHPDTKYIHGRPDWQITADKRTENINQKITIGFPCLAFVYRQGDDFDEAVPTDVVEIKARDEDVHVILEKNYNNVIVLKNLQGKLQFINEK
jgi:hypothetical protein